MRNDYKKRKNVKARLYGIGIGPGDPKLLTIKAKEILGKVDTIFVPKSSDSAESCARAITESASKGKKNYIELTFPMTKSMKILNSYWKKAASRIAQEVRKNKDVAFVTIGDPFVYSTYIYLLKTLYRDFPDIKTETIPGITSFNAAAACGQFPLVEGNEKLAILPVKKNLEGLKEAFNEFDTVVLMKVGSKLKKVLGLLKKMGLAGDSLLVSRAGQPQELIVRGLDSLQNTKLGYLSVIIVKRKNKKGR